MNCGYLIIQNSEKCSFPRSPRLIPGPYLFVLKDDERLGRNDFVVAGQAGKGDFRFSIFVRPTLDAVRSVQNRLRSDWERRSPFCFLLRLRHFPIGWYYVPVIDKPHPIGQYRLPT